MSVDESSASTRSCAARFGAPSLAALTILDAGPAGQIRAAAAAGFRSVGLRLMPLLDSDARVVGNASAEREIVQALAESGMAVLEVGVFPLKPEMDWPLVEAVSRFSARIGARFLVCPVEDTDTARRVETLRRLCDLCGPLGLRALVEFNPYSGCGALAEAVGIIEMVERPGAGLVIDVLHLSRSGGSPDDLVAIPAEHLALVHLCDAAPAPDRQRSRDELRVESRTARLLPGEGVLWLDRLLDVLPAGTPLSIEAPSARHAKLSATERARLALSATQALLDRHIARGGQQQV